MPDILIRGIEMPTDCGKCFVGDRTICADGCHLVELPPHGDLIDRDEIKFTCAGTTPVDLDYALRYVIDRMPAIVPADKEETHEQSN